MPDRNQLDEREKLDHSNHPTTRSLPGDLRAPGSVSTRGPDASAGSRDGGSAGSRDRTAGPPLAAAPHADDHGTGDDHGTADHGVSSRKHSRLRRLDSRTSSNK